MSLSDSSSLSSPPSSDDEAEVIIMPQPTGLNKYFKPAPKPEVIKPPSSPPLPKRPASPPHEYVLADNAEIAVSAPKLVAAAWNQAPQLTASAQQFIVMFRSRFSNIFPKSLPHYGPQDIENGVTDAVPGDHIERLLCALLGLVLNRKKEVERGHFGRALEEAIHAHSSQWPPAWKEKNPLHGGGSFANMGPVERITLLKTLIIWSLSASDAVQATIKESYKQSRHEDDKNQPLSVQPWGRDGYKRNYWLIEGQDDTHFRVYRENNGATAKTNTWFSVAGSIEEITRIADKLDEENTPHARTLRDRIRAAIPRFEAGEEKRRRRDYRLARKAAFTRPEPGFSLYEGRTRGKRIKYTYSEDDDDGSDAMSSRRSTRPSGISTPAEHAGPTVTASGRQVKSRLGGMYGESILVDQRKEIENERAFAASQEPESKDGDEESTGRPRRTARQSITNRRQEVNGDDGDLEEESEAESTGDDWSGDEDEPDEPELEPDFEGDDEDDEMSADDSEMDDIDVDERPSKSLVVQLRYRKKPQTHQESKDSPKCTKPDAKTTGQSTLDGSMAQPVVLQPSMPTLEARSNYPSSGLPHHFGATSPTSHSQPFTNGVKPADLRSQTSEKLQEPLLYQQPPALQFSRFV